MTAPKRYMVTSALPYANGPLHIGHIAGAMLPADILVRYLRAAGEEVLYVCGSDEHGAAITLRARKEGVSAQEIVDRYHVLMRDTFAAFGIDFDIYDRTSSPEHHANAQEFFLELLKNDAFEVKTEKQYYDVEAAQFLADRYIIGTCPKCANENAYGDQCERCGSALSPTDLINPRSVLSGSSPELRETSLWYLPMQRHEAWLRKYIEQGELDGVFHHDPRSWKKHVIGQCKSWIDGGLQSRAMTRDLDWGVPVPLEGADGKVLYVWLDAPIGYISATRRWAESRGEDWQKWWKSDDTALVHFIGKDNIVFHCLIFPILLKAHQGYILPTNVPANEFMNLEGDKISTSRNWAVWLHEYLEDFPGREDELRYVLCSIMPEQKDSEFTWVDFKDRVNNELADILGNFVNRALVLTHKYYEGVVPAPAQFTATDKSLIAHIRQTATTVGDLIRSYKFREAQMEAMNLARAGNKYMTEEEPWKLVKTDPERVKTILYLCLQVTANLPVVLHPFLPRTSAKLAGALGLPHLNWKDSSAELLQPGQTIGTLPILFTKIEDDTVTQQIDKLHHSRAIATSKPMNTTPQKANVSFEQFAELDVRIVEIVAAERVAKTKKLLKLTVNTGIDERTVVSGIAEHYNPEDVVGKRVCLLLNLAPREIKGIVSQGMVLMASNPDGSLSFVTPERGGEIGDEVR
jgi:methionyl-tRNA synthetase